MTCLVKRFFLNENQVAQRLGVSIATVRRWRAQKSGPRFRRIGGASIRYASEDLKHWIESQPSGGGDPFQRLEVQ